MQACAYKPLCDYAKNSSDSGCWDEGTFKHFRLRKPKMYFSFSSSSQSSQPHDEVSEDYLRKELKYFFQNPCEKYKERRRKPFKLVLQICKIAMITIQLIVFGQSHQHIVSFMNDNIEGIKRIVLPTTSEIYTTQELSDHINYIQKQFASLKNSSLGIYGYTGVDPKSGCQDNSSSPNHNMCFCLHEYTDICLKNCSFEFERKSKRRFCTFLQPWSEGLGDNGSHLIPFLNGSLFQLQYEGIITIKLHFGVRTVLLESAMNENVPDCYKIMATIMFDNKFHSGKISRYLNTTFIRVQCDNKIQHNWFSGKLVSVFVFDCFIILACAISFLLCSRSILKAIKLRRCFERFFIFKYGKRLSCWEKMDFFNGWYFLIVVSDMLTIAGTISKIVIDFTWEGVLDYNACSLFLGLGCLCVWIGVLRYVGYFHQYNILVLTMKRSLPHVLRFMVCASIMYLGFMFCGWVVIGPYHHKFRNPVVASEALFSLINGDDMYMTYEEMPHSKPIPWVFSQIYLYTFISLFIYIVLSLFIAVIMETYETIKEWQAQGFPPQTVLQKFIDANCGHNLCVDDDFVNDDSGCCCCLNSAHPSTTINEGSNELIT